MKTATMLASAAIALAAGLSQAQAHDTVAPGAMNHEAMSDASASAKTSGQVVRARNLEISGAYTKAMLPGQPVGGGYLTIKNTGSADDVLLSASSPAAGAVEIHEMAMQGQVMKMRRIEGGLAIGAGKSVSLAPGGLHLMFIHLNAPFREGQDVPLTLMFKSAGKVEVTLPVKPAGAQGHN
jgi:copper(I)-binding protein